MYITFIFFWKIEYFNFKLWIDYLGSLGKIEIPVLEGLIAFAIDLTVGRFKITFRLFTHSFLYFCNKVLIISLKTSKLISDVFFP